MKKKLAEAINHIQSEMYNVYKDKLESEINASDFLRNPEVIEAFKRAWFSDKEQDNDNGN